MSIDVLKPGLLTTLQDRGRAGFAALGVGRAGPMDEVAFRLANALVGNASGAPALEITLIGPRLRFDADAVIALTGAEFPARIDELDMRSWRPHRIAAGAVLDIGNARRGARGYLAIAGGFMVEPVLGSMSTDVNARIGPFGGRALRMHDTLVVGAASAAILSSPRRTPSPPDSPDPQAQPSGVNRRADQLFASAPHPLEEEGLNAPRLKPLLQKSTAAARASSSPQTTPTPAWSLDPRPWFDPDSTLPIRLIRGTHFDALDAPSRDALFGAGFRIAVDSNRIGFRLDGPRLALAAALELVSEPVAFGTLQLPPDGQAIALMAEHPTIGGYPRIGQIAAIDLPRLAQRRPGESVCFGKIGLDEAQTRYLARERELARLFDTIATRLARHD